MTKTMQEIYARAAPGSIRRIAIASIASYLVRDDRGGNMSQIARQVAERWAREAA